MFYSGVREKGELTAGSGCRNEGWEDVRETHEVYHSKSVMCMPILRTNMPSTGHTEVMGVITLGVTVAEEDISARCGSCWVAPGVRSPSQAGGPGLPSVPGLPRYHARGSVRWLQTVNFRQECWGK